VLAGVPGRLHLGRARHGQRHWLEARDRYAFNSFKRKREEAENDKRLEAKALMKLADLEHHSQHKDASVLDRKRAVIESALARARAKQCN